MLSLLSLLLASGKVLQGSTERWTPTSYPDPRANHTECNTWEDSTLCDPDHILSANWRRRIHNSISKHCEKLRNSEAVHYTERSSRACHAANGTQGVQIYVLLAKQIQTAGNRSIVEEDMIAFGNEITKNFGLDSQDCKNFVMLVGVEAAKLAYVRTGRDLKLPSDFIQKVFHQYKLFKARDYMEGLSRIVEEIGSHMADPFKSFQPTSTIGTTDITTSPSTPDPIIALLNAAPTEDTELNSPTNSTPTPTGFTIDIINSTNSHYIHSTGTPWWVFLLLSGTILAALLAIAWVAISQQKEYLTGRRKSVVAGK